MRILALGDIVGSATIDYLKQHLWSIRSREKIDLVVANGENVSAIRGINTEDARALMDTGIDLITLGNHAYGCRDIYPYLDESDQTILRPANYPPASPGSGYTILHVNGWRILAISICGRVYLDPLACPFETVEKILEREKGAFDFALMDIHGEATSEKLAIAHVFDGRIAVMFGTHTHVPTADEQILPGGSGYLTDLGMCGPKNGILGTATEDVIYRFRTLLPTRWSVAEGPIAAYGAIFDVDESAGRVRAVRRITF